MASSIFLTQAQVGDKLLVLGIKKSGENSVIQQLTPLRCDFLLFNILEL